jgi:hypothetical protein
MPAVVLGKQLLSSLRSKEPSTTNHGFRSFRRRAPRRSRMRRGYCVRIDQAEASNVGCKAVTHGIARGTLQPMSAGLVPRRLPVVVERGPGFELAADESTRLREGHDSRGRRVPAGPPLGGLRRAERLRQLPTAGRPRGRRATVVTRNSSTALTAPYTQSVGMSSSLAETFTQPV